MAGRKNRYGYSEYRGRSGRGRPVLIFIIVLLAVLLAAGVAFMLLMGDYIKYTDTGMEIDWPWMSSGPSAPPEITDPVAVESEPVVVTVEPTPEPTPTLPPEPQYQPLAAVTVTADQLRGGAAAQAVANAGGNALVVEMKSGNGRLAWQSQTELAASLSLNAADDGTAQAVRELAQAGDLYLVARVHCFKDPALARAGIGTLMTQGGNIWYDFFGICWTSPANQQAADYLSALCLELADMGFDEILLDSAGYPNSGEVNVLAVSDNRPADLTVPVSAFLERVSGELEARNVRLAVSTDETLLPGNAVLSGLTAGVLAQHAGRVWLSGSASAQQYTDLLAAAGWQDTSPRLVVKNALTGAGSWYR